jgi:hypothetical protein
MSIRAQIKIFAGTDIFISMHGSGIVNSVFMPPRSIIIEIMPEHTMYRLHSQCFSHDEQIWVQMVKKNNTLESKSVRNRLDSPFRVNVQYIKNVLDKTWHVSTYDAFGVNCVNVTGKQWMLQSATTEDKLGCGGGNPTFDCKLPNWNQKNLKNKCMSAMIDSVQVNNKILHANNRIIKYNCATTIYMVLNNDYFENGAVMLHSLKRHLNMKYCIKILYSKTLPNANLEESSKSKLCQHLGICDFINIKTQWQKIVKLKNIKAYPALLALNTFDDNSSDIVLFLDADMLVIRDFSNIFEKLSDDYVHGSAPTKEQKYINTGFFCMTRGFLAKQNRTRQIQSFITEKDLLSNKINRNGDQDIINRVFPVINHEWYVNYRPKKNKDIEKFNIIHWSGMIKPNKSPGVFRTNQKGPSIMNDLWKKERNMLNWL